MTSTAHDITSPVGPRVEEVGPGVHAYIQPDGTWWITNTGFLVGSRGVVSVDACSTERRTRAYLSAIAHVTPLPVRTLVNTRHPFDAPVWTPVEWGAITAHTPNWTVRRRVRGST